MREDQGLDTVDANLALGFRDDERDYAIAAHMLMSLNVKSIQLMTNNPDKLESLEQLGISVEGRIPVLIAANEHSASYLEAKRRLMRHELPRHDLPGGKKRTAGG